MERIYIYIVIVFYNMYIYINTSFREAFLYLNKCSLLQRWYYFPNDFSASGKQITIESERIKSGLISSVKISVQSKIVIFYCSFCCSHSGHDFP